MKKGILLLTIVAALTSCHSTKTSGLSQHAGTAVSLLQTLSPNSKLTQIASLFTLLDTNKDKAISSTEAIGQVANNFTTLDKDKNSTLNLAELGGLLGLLK